VSELYEQIAALIADSERDLDTIERTLTDGYAYALRAGSRALALEKRLAEGGAGAARRRCPPGRAPS
jgi:hypothetical protein